MTVEDDVLARAAELMLNAPGNVSVRRISQIDDVRLLRRARETLTEAEAERLPILRLELMERLDGAVPAQVKRRDPRAKGIVGRLMMALQNGGEAMRTQGQVAPPNERDAPTRLPAPKELLDAAEAWVVAHWTESRLGEDTQVLRTPWEQASIDPVD